MQCLMFNTLKIKNFLQHTENSETPGTSIDPGNGDKTYSDVSVFSRGCQSSRGKRHEGGILSEFQEARSSDVGNHLRKRASAGANHRITFYARIKTSTVLAFAFLLRYHSISYISDAPNH